MKINFNLPQQNKSQTLRYIYYAIAALLLSVINVLILDFIAIGTFTPDFILILCVWIALSEGQFVGIFAAFACGILFDVISHDVIGTNALAKTVVGFVAGFFYRENKSNLIIGSYRFILITLLCAVIHNLIYYFFYIKPTEISFIPFFLKYGLASSLYTTVFAVLAMLFKIPRKGL
ncbi:MAG: rod shape-determining protein MreD [Bacteroidota bacterium]